MKVVTRDANLFSVADITSMLVLVVGDTDTMGLPSFDRVSGQNWAASSPASSIHKRAVPSSGLPARASTRQVEEVIAWRPVQRKLHAGCEGEEGR